MQTKNTDWADSDREDKDDADLRWRHFFEILLRADKARLDRLAGSRTKIHGLKTDQKLSGDAV